MPDRPSQAGKSSSLDSEEYGFLHLVPHGSKREYSSRTPQLQREMSLIGVIWAAGVVEKSSMNSLNVQWSRPHRRFARLPTWPQPRIKVENISHLKIFLNLIVQNTTSVIKSRHGNSRDYIRNDTYHT